MKKIPQWIKYERAARRLVEIELQLPKEHAKVWLTSKKDKASRKKVPNTVRDYD